MSTPFEIHITGDSSILYHADKLGIKTISVKLLAPDMSEMVIEDMTSYVLKSNKYEHVLEMVLNTVLKLTQAGVHISRVKIECPYLQEYIPQSIYLESHWQIEGIPTDRQFPISQNIRKLNKYMATDRTYHRDNYVAFKEKYKDVVTELCLFDTNIGGDLAWFEAYGMSIKN